MPSPGRAKLGWITMAAGLVVAIATGCSGDDAPGGASGSGGTGGLATASGGTAGSSGAGGSSGSSAGTGGSSAGSGGMPVAGNAGVAGTTSTGGAGGTATAGNSGSGGTSPAGAGGNGGSSGVAGSGGLAGAGGATGGGGATAGDAGTSAGGSAGGGTGGAAGTPSWCLPLDEHPDGVDWAKALIDSQIRSNVSLTWEYPDGLFLHGVYLAYKRLDDPAYLSLLTEWADANVAGKSQYNSLDDMQPSLVLDDLYRETGQMKYNTAPEAVATRLKTNYPKTDDGGYWHNTGATDQLWGDGVFMNLPPLVNYGDLNDDASALDIATQQLIIYDSHLQADNDLHVHQWDGSSGGNGRQSCCEWCRAEGWYEMALLIVLDFTPPTHDDYDALVEIAERLARGLAATQDPETGRWWQVMDKGNENGNWLETSCTAMHTYFLSKASQKGYIDAATYAPLAIEGFHGEMEMVSNANNVQIRNICPGTGVLASPAEYYARPPQTNDNHGLGAFLLMYDQLTCR